MKIVSNHCVGATLDRRLGQEFSSPFVWSLMLPKDYIKLIENLEECLSCDPRIIYNENIDDIKDVDNRELRLDKSSYPEIGDYPTVEMNGVYVHFIHNNTEKNTDIGDKLRKRTKRYLENKGETLFLFALSRYSNEDDIKKFKALELQHKLIVTEEEAQNWDLKRAIAFVKGK